MFRRGYVSVLGALAWSGPIVLGGCADAVAPRLPAPVAHQTLLVTTASIDSADAELVMARAIAEHEMRRP
jgi:hypothetical protein